MMNNVEVPDELPEAVRPLLRREGYEDETLRDQTHIRHHGSRERLRQEVQQAIAYLKQHVFPIHGLASQ